MTHESSNSDAIKKTGRGVVYITSAKLWFLLSGFVLAFGLPRIFKWSEGGDAQRGQELFGLYKLVFMGVSFFNNGLITGTIQAVSKFTAEDEASDGAIRRTALKVQFALGVCLASLYAGFAGVFADILGSPELASLMRLTAVIMIAYSCYAVFIGSFNGKRQYNRQAIFDVTYTTTKVALIIVLAAAGYEVLGTVMGFLIAAVSIAIIASLVSGRGGKGWFSARRYMGFAFVIIAYTFVLNLVMSLDLFLLKGISAYLARDAGFDVHRAAELSASLAGKYGAAQTLAFIPYQAILSIAFVVFPMISKSSFEQDDAKTRAYIRNTMRFSSILIVGIASVFTALPEQAITFPYQEEYRIAGGALGILSPGIAAFGLMVICNSILNGAGRPWRSIVVVLVALISVIGSVSGLLLFQEPGDNMLVATATGTSMGMSIGLLCAGAMVYGTFGAFWPLGTMIRVFLAAGVAVLLGRVLPDTGKFVTLIECIGVLAVYLGSLVVCGEFSRDDLRHLMAIFGREKNKGRT